MSLRDVKMHNSKALSLVEVRTQARQQMTTKGVMGHLERSTESQRVRKKGHLTWEMGIAGDGTLETLRVAIL